MDSDKWIWLDETKWRYANWAEGHPNSTADIEGGSKICNN